MKLLSCQKVSRNDIEVLRSSEAPLTVMNTVYSGEHAALTGRLSEPLFFPPRAGEAHCGVGRGALMSSLTDK